jgi:ABC-type nitrate/sulfonate/bicarbonate transport system permease component
MGADFDTTGVFAVLVVIGLLAVALNQLVEIVQVRQERWKIATH